MVQQVKQIRILLADDHNVMRRGLRLLLERQPGFVIVAEAADGAQAQRISALLPDTAIVILSMHSDEGYLLRALKAGAKGYLVKDSPEGDLIEAIKAVSEGKAFFSPEVSRMLVEDYVRELRTRGIEDSYDLLTSREREILHLLAEGKSNKDIAVLLNLSLFTVETHRRNLQDKLNVHSLAELILYAVRKGVIS
jgi:DNA-binding NarL/FixJ family response regulator